MTRSLYWMPNTKPEMECLNKSIPLMNAINAFYGEGIILLGQDDVRSLNFFKGAFCGVEAEMIEELVKLIHVHGSILVEVRR